MLAGKRGKEGGEGCFRQREQHVQRPEAGGWRASSREHNEVYH